MLWMHNSRVSSNIASFIAHQIIFNHPIDDTMSGQKANSSMPKPQPNALLRVYLFSYNVALALGWFYLLFKLVSDYHKYTYKASSVWYHLGSVLVTVLVAGLLEVVHSVAGIVDTKLAPMLGQLMMRLFLLSGVLMVTPSAIHWPGLPVALFAWSLTESVRHSYSSWKLLLPSGQMPKALVWLRYSVFAVVYPLGVLGELVCLWRAQEFVTQFHTSYKLPYHYHTLWAVMLLNAPMLPMVYMYMLRQRKAEMSSAVRDSAKLKSN